MTEDLIVHPNISLACTTAEAINPPEPVRIIDVASGEVSYTESDPGDAREFELLYLKNFRELGRIAYLLTNDVQEAEDVVADVYLRIAERYDVRNLDDPLAFLRAAVLNGARTVLRHRAVQERVLPKLLPGPTGDCTYESAASASDASAIVKALQQLPLRQRQAIVLRYYVDLNEQDTADTMGIKAGSVKSHTARGIAALRHILGPYMQEFK